jgi:flagellar hook-basal body complex protein FliE
MSDRMDINNVLSQIRDIRTQMQQPVKIRPELSPNQLRPTQQTSNVPAFTDMFKQAVNQVNDLQQNSATLTKAYQAGDPQVDLTEVMIASQKSSIGFQALLQVRNRVVKAYEDIMKMPV